MIKEGDKIICIDNSYTNFLGEKVSLSLDKIYEIIDIFQQVEYFVYVIDDQGIEQGFYLKRFISLAQYREQQIDNILN